MAHRNIGSSNEEFYICSESWKNPDEVAHLQSNRWFCAQTEWWRGPLTIHANNHASIDGSADETSATRQRWRFLETGEEPKLRRWISSMIEGDGGAGKHHLQRLKFLSRENGRVRSSEELGSCWRVRQFIGNVRLALDAPWSFLGVDGLSFSRKGLCFGKLPRIPQISIKGTWALGKGITVPDTHQRSCRRGRRGKSSFKFQDLSFLWRPINRQRPGTMARTVKKGAAFWPPSWVWCSAGSTGCLRATGTLGWAASCQRSYLAPATAARRSTRRCRRCSTSRTTRTSATPFSSELRWVTLYKLFQPKARPKFITRANNCLWPNMTKMYFKFTIPDRSNRVNRFKIQVSGLNCFSCLPD